MKMLHENHPECSTDEMCKAASEVLTPIRCATGEVQAGHIFFFPGHTGIVTNNFPSHGLIETLSYSRNMPQIEGLGYKNYSYTDKDFLFFEEKTLVSGVQDESLDEL